MLATSHAGDAPLQSQSRNRVSSSPSTRPASAPLVASKSRTADSKYFWSPVLLQDTDKPVFQGRPLSAQGRRVLRPQSATSRLPTSASPVDTAPPDSSQGMGSSQSAFLAELHWDDSHLVSRWLAQRRYTCDPVEVDEHFLRSISPSDAAVRSTLDRLRHMLLIAVQQIVHADAAAHTDKVFPLPSASPWSHILSQLWLTPDEQLVLAIRSNASQMTGARVFSALMEQVNGVAPTTFSSLRWADTCVEGLSAQTIFSLLRRDHVLREEPRCVLAADENELPAVVMRHPIAPQHCSGAHPSSASELAHHHHLENGGGSPTTLHSTAHCDGNDSDHDAAPQLGDDELFSAVDWNRVATKLDEVLEKCLDSSSSDPFCSPTMSRTESMFSVHKRSFREAVKRVIRDSQRMDLTDISAPVHAFTSILSPDSSAPGKRATIRIAVVVGVSKYTSPCGPQDCPDAAFSARSLIRALERGNGGYHLVIPVMSDNESIPGLSPNMRALRLVMDKIVAFVANRTRGLIPTSDSPSTHRPLTPVISVFCLGRGVVADARQVEGISAASEVLVPFPVAGRAHTSGGVNVKALQPAVGAKLCFLETVDRMANGKWKSHDVVTPEMFEVMLASNCPGCRTSVFFDVWPSFDHDASTLDRTATGSFGDSASRAGNERRGFCSVNFSANPEANLTAIPPPFMGGLLSLYVEKMISPQTVAKWVSQNQSIGVLSSPVSSPTKRGGTRQRRFALLKRLEAAGNEWTPNCVLEYLLDKLQRFECACLFTSMLQVKLASEAIQLQVDASPTQSVKLTRGEGDSPFLVSVNEDHHDLCNSDNWNFMVTVGGLLRLPSVDVSRGNETMESDGDGAVVNESDEASPLSQTARCSMMPCRDVDEALRRAWEYWTSRVTRLVSLTQSQLGSAEANLSLMDGSTLVSGVLRVNISMPLQMQRNDDVGAAPSDVVSHVTSQVLTAASSMGIELRVVPHTSSRECPSMVTFSASDDKEDASSLPLMGDSIRLLLDTIGYSTPSSAAFSVDAVDMGMRSSLMVHSSACLRKLRKVMLSFQQRHASHRRGPSIVQFHLTSL